LILVLLLTAALLIRMGVKIFNRDALLGQDIDQIRFGWMWQTYWNRFRGRLPGQGFPSPREWIRQLLSRLIELKHPSGMLAISILGGLLVGVLLLRLYPLPEELTSSIRVSDFAANMSSLGDQVDQLPSMIFWQNFRVIAIAALLGIFTLGVTDVILFMLPWIILGYLSALIGANGENPLLFAAAVTIPHALFEVPALLLAFAAALRWHAAVLSPPPGRTVGESWLMAAADFVRITIVLVIPLLIIAALVEAYVTPQIIIWVYGS
ncbi:MAG: stage II sporulation protein M, partial [Candidatus Promineifilaceae bacterium]